jgi:5-methylcytosine-specific restriction endonuclease McrA
MSRSLFDIEIKPVNVWGVNKKNRKRQITHAQKIFAWENKTHTCNICGKRVTKFSEAEFDHTRAHSKSGATNLSNIKIVHRACNRLKGKKSLSETKKILGIKSKPKRRKITKKKSIRKKSPNLFEIPTFKVPDFKL